MSSINIIVARDKRSGIGINNQMPWHLAADFAHFKKTTLGHPILMGRKTFESIGRPLPGRRNIVISRQPDWQAEGVEVCHSLPAALALCQNDDVYIIGGAQIYHQAMEIADRLVVTEIDKEFACDAFFPVIHEDQWQIDSSEAHLDEAQKLAYAFVIYTKKTGVSDVR